MDPEVSLAYIGTFENIATNLSQRSVALNGKIPCRNQYVFLYIRPVPDRRNVFFLHFFWRTIEFFY